MASKVLVLAHGPGTGADLEALAERVVGRLRELEERWSRFRPTSELSVLNAAAGSSVEVSADTLVLVDALVRAWSLTDGLCDASVLPAVLAGGDTHSRTEGASDGSGGARAAAGPAPGLGSVVVDATAGQVTLPAGVAIDSGAIGKGLAADLAVVEAVLGGATGALVSVGGDLRAGGQPPPGGWPVVVERATDRTHAVTTLLVDAGGVATSSTLSRRIVRGGSEGHHVIDPRTGTAAATDLASATVVASTAWEAEALATAALIRGAAEGYSTLTRDGVGGILQTLDGGVVMTPDLAVDGTTWPMASLPALERGRR